MGEIDLQRIDRLKEYFQGKNNERNMSDSRVICLALEIAEACSKIENTLEDLIV